MKSLTDKYFLQASLFLKISILVLTCVALFYLGKHWSDGFQQIIFFNSQQFTETPSIEISPNFNKTFDFSDLIGTETDSFSDDRILHSSSPSAKVSFPPVALPPPPPPPPPPLMQKFGIVDVNGTMAEEFEIGEFDPQLIEEWGKNETVVVKKGRPSRGKVKRFSLCKETMRQYIPCLDNVEAIKMLKTTEKGEMFERHCPGEGKSLNCLVPAPSNYKNPIPWPRSRDEVWFSNVPNNRLVEDKGGQNWISRYKDKFRFPGGANQYLDQISRMVPNAFGRHTRVALDIGCGVASFGAFLLSRNVITLSVAPKDIHENQIQFALERGVPAMVAVLATHRLLYPSQAFDLIHCSRCTINWIRDDGILLLEVNRILRAGGYFVWAAQPVSKHEDSLQEQWKEMEDLTSRLCWKLLKKEGYLGIWKKPLDNTCYNSRDPGVQPPLCDSDNDPDSVWYIGLKACITPLPGNGYGANVSTWPARLYNPPDRLQSIQMDAYISRNELFKAELKYWDDILGSYVRAYRWKKFKLRNVLDMRAGFGGFAAALYDKGIDCWVLNVVPISGPNTLPVIYDRGLIGVMHDWCEPLDTYPRTYDLLHAAGLFSIEQNRCSITSIMLEMDRILRPGGRVYIRDYVSIIYEVQEIAEAMGWRTVLRQTSEGPHASWKILTCDKRLLRS